MSHPELDVSFPVVATKNYKAGNIHEMDLIEKQTYYVLNEKDLFYLLFDSRTKIKGYAPKNYLMRQKPLTAYSAVCIYDFTATSDKEMSCLEGDKVIVVAKCNSGYVLCKNITRVVPNGKVPLQYLSIEGDIENLMNLDDYRNRTSSSGDTTNTRTSTSNIRSRSNTGPLNHDEEDKILEKISTSKARSSSVSKMLQLLSPPKEY